MLYGADELHGPPSGHHPRLTLLIRNLGVRVVELIL